MVLLGLSFEIYEPASQALIADSVAPVDRPAAFGMLGASLSAAALVAGLLATILAPQSLRLLFVADSATCLAAALVVLSRLPRTAPTDHLVAARKNGRSPWRDATFVFLFTTNTVFAACYLQVFVTLPFTLDSHGIGPGGLGVLLTVSALTVIAGVPLLRSTRTRLRTPRAAIVTGFALVGVGFLGYAVANNLAEFVAATVVGGIGDVLLMGHLMALVSAVAPGSQRAGFLAAYGLSWGVAATLGPPLGDNRARTRQAMQGCGSRPAACSAAVGGLPPTAARVGSRS